MDDRRYERIQRDNAEVLHVVESPLRALMLIIKCFLFLLGLLFLLFYRQVGWVVNVGPRSQSARQARAALLERQLKHYNGELDDSGQEWAQYEVDFRVQPDPSVDLESRDRFWPDDHLPWVESNVWDSDADNHRTKAFTTNLDPTYGAGRHGIPYCVVALHPGMRAKFFDDSPGDWGIRWNDALDRKAARMRDYESAAMMTAALRYTLATLKLHRPLDVRPENYCDANQGDQAYRQTLRHTVLVAAPVLRVKYIAIEEYNGDTTPDHAQYLAEIMGFCIPPSCVQPLLWGTTYKDDLFAPDAPLTDEQLFAEEALRQMADEGFWLMTARQEGVADMVAVKEAHRRAVQDLNREFVTFNYQILTDSSVPHAYTGDHPK